MTSNRNPIRQMFITFPKSNISKHEFRDKLLRFEPEYYKVCEELHQDGTPHLHALIKFKNKYSKAKVLSYFKEIYPDDYKRIDVEPVRSITKALLYLSKEDKTPLESGAYIESRNPQHNWLDKFARELGYSDRFDCIAKYKQEQLVIEEVKKLVAKKWNYYVVNYREFYPDQKTRKIYENLFCKNIFVKDDITFLLKEMNIKYELTT